MTWMRFDVLKVAVDAAGSMDQVCDELTRLQVALGTVPDSVGLMRKIEAMRKEAYAFRGRVETLATLDVARIIQQGEASDG